LNENKSKDIYSEIQVTLVFENNHIAETINNSTNPENKEAPEGVISASKIEGNKIILFIKSEKSILDLLRTLEDYFEKIDLSYKTIKNV
jgi:tRNA threonylcarbamoyladenosine modification (KEOPS) complex  Pcc1 subunit